MSINDPTWSYGESRLYNSSGAVTDPDDAWVYGENELLHEYVEATCLLTDYWKVSPSTVVEKMLIGISAKAPGVTPTSKTPGATFGTKVPGIDITGRDGDA